VNDTEVHKRLDARFSDVMMFLIFSKQYLLFKFVIVFEIYSPLHNLFKSAITVKVYLLFESTYGVDGHSTNA
jgi:hypothetical protein